MIRRHFYLFLAIIGLVIPYYFLISFLISHGVDVRLFFNQLFGTPISTFFAVDLLLSCVVFVRFLGEETRRYAMKNTWIRIVMLLSVGLSCALPLFLYLREPYLAERR